MMKFNDEQLTEILKQVQVPSDLKDQLRQIPLQESVIASTTSLVSLDLTRDQTKSRLSRRRMLGWLSLATTAVLLLGLIWANQGEPSKVSHIDLTAKDNSSKVVESENQSTPSDVGPESRQINSEPLTLVQLQSELNDIEKQLVAVNSKRPPATRYRLDEDEFASLLIATASQTAIMSGVSIEYLRSDLEESVQRFPETRGSAIAAQLLASAAAQN